MNRRNFFGLTVGALAACVPWRWADAQSKILRPSWLVCWAREFSDQEIDVGKMCYADCKFTRCTFVNPSGRPFRFNNCYLWHCRGNLDWTDGCTFNDNTIIYGPLIYGEGFSVSDQKTEAAEWAEIQQETFSCERIDAVVDYLRLTGQARA